MGKPTYAAAGMGERARVRSPPPRHSTARLPLNVTPPIAWVIGVDDRDAAGGRQTRQGGDERRRIRVGADIARHLGAPPDSSQAHRLDPGHGRVTTAASAADGCRERPRCSEKDGTTVLRPLPPRQWRHHRGQHDIDVADRQGRADRYHPNRGVHHGWAKVGRGEAATVRG